MSLLKLNYMRNPKAMLAISGAVILACLIALGVLGLNRGIDFAGGYSFDVRFDRQVSNAELEAVVTEVAGSDVRVQRAQAKAGAENPEASEFLVRTPVLDDDQREKLLAGFASIGEYEVLGEESVSASVSRELTEQAALAILIAALLQVIYIWIRFELRFGVAAVAALLHDLVVTLGLVSILQIQINAPFVAAILTVLGYSINDTIVVFDRVRENLERRKKGESLEEMTTRSIQQTILRSIYTSGSTLLVLGSLIIFGGDSTRDMATTLFIGIAAGTYSSVVVAPSIWLQWRTRDDERRQRSVSTRPAKV